MKRSGLVLVMLLALAAGCTPPAPAESTPREGVNKEPGEAAASQSKNPEGGPEAVITRFHEAWSQGEMEAVHASVDYEHRLDEVLGDTWRGGTPEARAQMVVELKGMLERTTTRLWPADQRDRRHTLKTTPGEGESRWVSATVDPPPKAPLVWKYQLHRGSGGWKITRREAVVAGVETNTNRFFSLVLGHLQKSLGHPPNLAEIARELPAWRERVRQRSTRLRLPGARRRAAPATPGQESR